LKDTVRKLRKVHWRLSIAEWKL